MLRKGRITIQGERSFDTIKLFRFRDIDRAVTPNRWTLAAPPIEPIPWRGNEKFDMRCH